MMTHTLRILLIAFLAGCAAKADGLNPTGLPLRQRMIDAIKAMPPDPTLEMSSKTFDELTEEYFNRVVVQPRRQKVAEFEFVDESGRRIDGVDVTIRRVKVISPLPTDGLDGGLDVKTSELRVDGTLKASWPDSRSSLELIVWKPGYRRLQIFLPSSLSKPAPQDKLRLSIYYLLPGHLLPAEKGDSMRIVLPPALIWPPDQRYQQQNDSNVAGWSVRELPKALIPLSDRPVVSTDRPGMVPAPVRGTYALVDADGRILRLETRDAGNLLGVSIRTYGRRDELRLVISTWGNRSLLKPESPRYQWQLYAEPTPRPLDEIKAEYERLNRPPIQGGPVPNAPSTAPTAQP